MKRLAICVAVLGLAACGGSGGGTLTKAQYDAKLSRLCLGLNPGVEWPIFGPQLICRVASHPESFFVRHASLAPERV